VCDSPDWLGIVGSEDGVMNNVTIFHNRSGHTLSEALLVTYLLSERSVGDENDLRAEDIDLEDRAWGRIMSEMLMKGLATHHTDLRVSSAISKYSLGPHRRYCQAEGLPAAVG
jgi:hypothetical protein